MSSSEDNYVGYKNPPTNTQFPKGTSGNPKGRPKKRPAEEIERVFNQQLDITIDGKHQSASLPRALLLKTVILALEGNPKATRAIRRFVEKASLAEADPPPPRITEIQRIIMTTEFALSKLGALNCIGDRWQIEPWVLKAALLRNLSALSGCDYEVLSDRVTDKAML
jgi:hypothetical protein